MADNLQVSREYTRLMRANAYLAHDHLIKFHALVQIKLLKRRLVLEPIDNAPCSRAMLFAIKNDPLMIYNTDELNERFGRLLKKHREIFGACEPMMDKRPRSRSVLYTNYRKQSTGWIYDHYPRVMWINPPAARFTQITEADFESL